MTRRAGLLVAIGLAGVVALAALWAAGRPVLPSYLAAWLFVLACPLGALPLVMAHDLLRRPETPLAAALRAMLPLVVAALAMGVPVVLQRAALYPTAATTGGFAGAWMAPGAIILRAVAAAVLWLGLAALFRRPPHRRPGWRGALAGCGLMLHLVLGTLVVGDWIAALDPIFISASLPLTVLVGQAGVALSAAILLTGERSPPVQPPGLALLGLLGAWLFLEVTQYLVVWSANLPTEVPWYIARDAGFGGVAEAGAAVVFLLALGLLKPRASRVVAIMAGVILALHLVATFWLVVPASRGAFDPALADLAAALGLVGLAAAALLALRPRPAPQEAPR